MIARSRPLRFLILSLAATSWVNAQTPPPVVRTTAPIPATKAVAYSVPGRTEPIESARVFTRATGIVKERRFDIGDQVKAGEILAVIDVPDLTRAVESARANVEQAEARAANAKTLAQRATQLITANSISREEADQRTANADIAEAALRAARSDLAKIEEQLNFATVRSPFAAVVAARNFDRGDRVRGDAATAEGWLYQLVRLDTLRFTLSAAPDLALRLTAGTKAQVRFSEFPGRSFAATVARSSRVFDPTAGTMRVELQVENPDLTLPAGLTGTAVFELAPAPGTFLVPTNTIISRAGQNSLATVKDGTVSFVDVSLGRNLGATVEVTSAALSPKTAVIVNPNALFRPGDAVSVAAPTAAK
jgi:membrane fusion protein (multidrug efflux system)